MQVYFWVFTAKMERRAKTPMLYCHLVSITCNNSFNAHTITKFNCHYEQLLEKLMWWGFALFLFRKMKPLVMEV